MVFQIILILIVIVVGAYVLGIGTDFLDDIATNIDEKLAKQSEVPSATDEEIFENTANLAKDRGTRVCDLWIDYFVTMTNLNPTGIEIANFAGDRWLWIGEDFREFGPFSDFIAGNTAIFEYGWLCESEVTTTTTSTSTSSSTTPPSSTTTSSPLVAEGSTGQGEICRIAARGTQVCETLSFLSLLGWNLEKNTAQGIEQLSLLAFGFDESEREVIRVNFIGESKTDDRKRLYAPEVPTLGTIDKPFTDSFRLGVGEDFPIDVVVGRIYLDDVTEDNYLMEFWYDSFPVNNKNVGKHFFKDLCKPGLSDC